MRRRRKVTLTLVGSILLASLALGVPGVQAHGKDKPSRVLIIMLDQARPDTIKRYDMDNVKALMRDGVSFPNALVGHMAAETVISHNVITSGLFPKHMGWSNEVYRDVDGVLGTAGDYYVTSSMSCSQFQDSDRARPVQEAAGLSRRPVRLGVEVRVDRPEEDLRLHGRPHLLRGRRRPDRPRGLHLPDPRQRVPDRVRPRLPPSNWRQPEFVSGSPPPAYLGLAFPCSRWSTWQEAGAYGTGGSLPAAIYPLDGDRFVPGGATTLHVGGDNWSADAAIRVIEGDPDWRGMLVSLGAIDKMGHMWGPEDNVTGPPGSDEQLSHLPFAAKNADAQVGRIVDALRAKGILDETLIVVTADHAAQTGRPFLGRLDGPLLAGGVPCDSVNGSSGLRSDCNWYYGQDANETYRDPSPAVAALRAALTPPGGDPVADTNLAFSYQDGHVAAWLKDNSPARKRQAAAAALNMPGVIATYRLNDAQNRYRLFDTNPMGNAERTLVPQSRPGAGGHDGGPVRAGRRGALEDRRHLRSHGRPRRPQPAGPEHPDGLLRPRGGH